MRLRIATFNVENLAARNSYGPRERPETAAALSLFDFPEAETREAVEASTAVAVEDDKRELTALALAETRADILALQEVDNLGVLQAFFANYVHRMSDIRYGHFKLVSGNDPRGIDVAFAGRKNLLDEKAVTVRSYHEATFGELDCLSDELMACGIKDTDLVFNRDCLEVSLDLGDTELTLYLCHLKAMAFAKPGRQNLAPPIRRAEAKAVRRIIENRFGPGWREANWIIAGDLNDFRERIRLGGEAVPALPSTIDPLFDDFAVNPVDALPAGERWTFFYRTQVADSEEWIDEHVQLDHLLLSPALAAANPSPSIEILRRGLAYRVPLDPTDSDRSIAHLVERRDRYPRVGWDRPKASDHCPVVIEIDLPARRA